MFKNISKKFTLHLLLALMLIFIFSGQALALMYKLDPNDLSRQSDSIISGKVTGVSSQWDTEAANIVTTVTVDVGGQLKGEEEPKTLTVVLPGGTVDGVTQIVSDTPTFRVGEEVVLFLNEVSWHDLNFDAGAEDKFYTLCGNFQGKFKAAHDFFSEESEEGFREKAGLFSDPEGAGTFAALPAEETPYVSYHAYTPLPFRWTGLSPVIPYYVNAPAERVEEVNAAAGSWSSAGANFAFKYCGTHNRSLGQMQNSKNEIMWSNLGANNALAIAAIWVSQNVILEADMCFNTNYSWSTGGDWYGGGHDVQTVALHEFGHWVGLDHSDNPGSIMYYCYKGVQHQLHADDLSGIRHIYGEHSPVNPCTITTPDRPGGPAQGAVDVSYYYTASGSGCSNGHKLQYKFYFSDETVSTWRDIAECKKHWKAPGNYEVRVQTRCAADNNKLSALSAPFSVTIGTPPGGQTPEPTQEDSTPITKEHQVTISVEGQGTTSPALGSYQYQAGDEITLTATPDQNQSFIKWIVGSKEYYQPALSLTVSGNITAKAVFTKNPAPTGDAAPPKPDDAADKPGSSSDQPDSGQDERGARPEPAPSRPPGPGPVLSKTKYQLTVETTGEGTTTPAAGNHFVEEGLAVELRAEAAQGWCFVKWVIDDLEISSSSTKVNMDRDRLVTCYFVKQQAGDLTGDGDVSVLDVVLTSRHLLGLEELTAEQVENADVNGDGRVDVLDVTLIMKKALGLIDTFPVEN